MIVHFFSDTSCNLTAGLESINLTDIGVIVRLMSLCVCGHVAANDSDSMSTTMQHNLSSGARPKTLPPGGNSSGSNSQLSPSSGLTYLSLSIGALIQGNDLARGKLLKLCTKVGVREPLCFVININSTHSFFLMALQHVNQVLSSSYRGGGLRSHNYN